MADKMGTLPSKMGNVDPDLEAEKPSTLRKRPLADEQNVGHISSERKQWLFFVWLMTAFIPDFALKHLGGLISPSQMQAWREKAALCIFVAVSSVLAIFWLEGFSLLLCPQEKSLLGPTVRHYDIGELAKETNLVAVNGRVFDLRKSSGPVSRALRPYVGKDASSMFPLFTALGRIGSATGGYADPVVTACVTNSSIADNWLSRRVVYDDSTMRIADGKLLDCPVPGATYEERISATKGETCFYNAAAFEELESMQVGFLLYYWSIIELGPGEDWKPHYIVIDKNVYDMTWYFKLALFRLSNIDNAGTTEVIPKPQTMFMDQNVSLALGTYGNNDATPVIEAFGKTIEGETVACLNRLFFAGHIQSFRERALCQVGNPILWAASAVVYALTFVKFAASFHFWRRQKMSYMDKYCVLFIPCYTEGTESLKNTINSLALTDYADDRKLLCVLCDGNLTGTGNAKPTPRLVLDVLNYKGEEPESFVYEALGEGKAKINMARVYVGHYTIQYHVVPYIVIAKMGKPSEQKHRPGNRGKRDSQLILMRFFSRLLKEDNLLCPLEYEIYHKIEKSLGIDPKLYEFVLMVDADTKVKADALDELIGSMLSNADRIALCGETQVANKAKNWVTAIQVHEYYISHHIGKAFESYFGKVTCLPGCFSLYRIKYPDSRPVLVHDDIIAEYSQNKVQTLHMKNLLHLGEDRFLTTLMLKYFPKRRLEFIFSAICWTDIPDTFAILLSQRRRWINSTFHNLFELLKLPNLCGVCFLSMKMVIISDLTATIILPISTLYMYWIIGKVIYLSQVDSASNEYIFVLAGLAAMYGTHVIIFIAKRQYSYIWWLLIYIILGLPIFSIVLPLYAFWHFDEFGWGTTRRIQIHKDLATKEEALAAGDPDARVVLTRRTLKEYQRNDTRLHAASRASSHRSKNSDAASISSSQTGARGPAPTRLPPSIHVDSHLHGVIGTGSLSPSEQSPGPVKAAFLFARNSTTGTAKKPPKPTLQTGASAPLADLDELDKIATDLENI